MFNLDRDKTHLSMAVHQARKSLSKGGIPIGAVLVHKSGRIVSTGHNCRVQKKSNILHAEMDCLEKCGRPSAEDGGVQLFRECTMYTTLSPCIMCSATCVLYRIPRIVIGENTTFVGGEDLLRSNGAEIINLDNAECKKMMADWIKGDGREIWWEDIGLLGEEEKA